MYPWPFLRIKVASQKINPQLGQPKKSSLWTMLAASKHPQNPSWRWRIRHEWHQAWRHLLELIRTFLPDDFHAWEVHYTFILNRENHAELWPVYLTYDAEICKRTAHFPIDPSVFSLSIWNDLEARHTAKKVLDMVQLDLKKQSGHFDNSQNSRSWNSNQNSSFCPRETSASDNTKTGRCIFCGDRTKSHYSHNCTASYNTSGAPCHLH